MTRINIIDPNYLTDQHLVAEIKEINQLSGSFRKSLNSKNGIIKSKIPKDFRLNSGHVYFFYDKGLYLKNRFYQLKEHAISRGMNITAEFNNEWHNAPQFYNDWQPSNRDIKIIVNRISEKIDMKPNWYKYYKRNIYPDVYKDVLNNLCIRDFKEAV